MKITGKTKVIALLGYPVTHSLSPLMHNTAFEHLGLDYCYVTFSVKPEMLKDAVEAIRTLNMTGVNVTVPHKENVIPFLDKLDKEALAIGAVNTIVNKDGRLIGYNTDGKGFMKSLSEQGIKTKTKTVLILGAGGASKAISYYLTEKAKGLYIYDIDIGKAEKLIGDLQRLGKTNVFFMDSPRNISDMDIIVNATPLGLKDSDPIPLDISLIRPSHIIGDLIYKETPLLKKAGRKGCRTFNGLGMLLWQGVFAFELWTGVKPPHELMRKSLYLFTSH
ncbi:MAG: shikimate dehydrogenase [Nitrospirae bacterium]|nr:shikimate dehydrogenase [Nitrospirota bacterium]